MVRVSLPTMATPVSLTSFQEIDAETAHEIARLHEQAAVHAYAHIFDAPFPREETRQRWTTYRGNVAVARRQGEVIGFVAWHGDELDALYVLPAQSGHGVGSALMDLATGTTRLWVLEQNARARAFYEARGWHPTGLSRAVLSDVTELAYARM